MVRTQYITIEELNEILGVSTYTDDDLVKVYEASEVIEYNLFNPMAKFDTLNAPKEIKLATAYQLQYMDNNDLFTEYTGGNFTLGKFSSSGNGNSAGTNDYYKLSSKARRYLVLSGYARRFV